ncbi:MAG: hypothetical protein M1818_002479 [Claussenomyces sp. TS43310]|nr:MAG: hypothetical protein M1818_002479 [Claussenomyces sp. TS43310]
MSSITISQELSDQPQKSAQGHESGSNLDDTLSHDERTESWTDRMRRIRRSATCQLIILGFLFFLGPGMFCAMNGLGGGGLKDSGPANTANVAVYATFAVVGFVSGPVVNKIGFRASLAMGGVGYSLYASSLLSYKLDSNSGFLISAGILSGIFSSLLWTSQGAMLISYTLPESRGRYISLVWGLFNLGAGLGSLLVFVLSVDSHEGGISVAMFVVFISLMFCCALGAVLICSPEKVLASNGGNGAPVAGNTWASAFRGLAYCLRTHTRIVTLFPMFFVSNFYYAYIFNDMNLRVFNIRTRALNNALFWMMEIPGSFILGVLLDQKSLARSARARLGFCLVLTLTVAIWAGGYVWQRRYSLATTSSPSFTTVDLSDSEYAGPVVLFMCYGFYDAVWQTFILWYAALTYSYMFPYLPYMLRLLGAIGDGSKVSAEFAGFYKGIQAAGAAVAFRTNMLQNESLTDLIVSWSMLLAALVFAGPVILFRIKH